MIGPSAATWIDAAGRVGDGLIATQPEESIVDDFQSGGDGDRPRYGQMTACYAESEAKATEVLHENWRNGGLPGELGQELPTPKHFDQAARLVDPSDLAESAAIGPDPEPYIESIEEYVDAGFDHVYVHQANPDAEGFFEFYEDKVLPEVS